MSIEPNKDLKNTAQWNLSFKDSHLKQQVSKVLYSWVDSVKTGLAKDNNVMTVTIVAEKVEHPDPFDKDYQHELYRKILFELFNKKPNQTMSLIEDLDLLSSVELKDLKLSLGISTEY